jgi:hypothetical protein
VRASSLALLALLTLGEIRLFDTLLYATDEDKDFVAESVRGVTSGHPVSASWQQRELGPWLVRAIARVTDVPLALAILRGVLMAAANLLLFFLRRRRGDDERAALIAVAIFGFLHAIYAYRIEYPWDWIDVPIFLAFGHHAARGGRLRTLWPLLLVGTINHETVLYLPLWYLLAPVENGDRKTVLEAALVTLAIGGAILLLRHTLYLGRPDLPERFFFEQPLPLVGNHLHLATNARRFFTNFGNLSLFVSLSLVGALGLLARAPRRAAIWTAIVIASVLAFGYLNETRHYLPLLAFWIAYA